ncbi:hypothetical protein NDU88_005224, partial [Pleurodeles waltl]
MGKDRTAKGAQQIKTDQFTAPSMGGGLQPGPSRASGVAHKSSEAQILEAIEAFGQVVQGKIASIAVDVNLLRTDLRAVAERSIATEQQVTTMPIDLDALKATAATL